MVEVVRGRKREAGMTAPTAAGAVVETPAGTREMTYLEAISDALRTEMRRDPSVFCLGEDIGEFGGAFKVTDGFAEEFGADRVLDTPLAENTIIGAAVGAAVEGMKPVCEMQFADFISCGFDQLVNVAAKLHYRQGVAVQIVVRLPSGGGFSGGPFHSQNPEAWFLQTPGLKVVAPATAADAKGLLTSAIRDPNPVCYLEHKGLYRRVRGEVPEGGHTVPLGLARVARQGSEMTVIAYGSSVHLALQAEQAFEHLDAPLARLTAPDVPIPFSPPLEQRVLPGLDDFKEACRELLAY
jgi:pyruvate/2-oxoglutarate/acetoin dehydrogenase E1 component